VTFRRRLPKCTMGIDSLSAIHFPSKIFQKWDISLPPNLSRSSLRARWLNHVQEQTSDTIVKAEWTRIEQPKKCLANSCNAGGRNQRVGSVVCGDAPPLRICIIGAGISGLYIAMMLDDLDIPGLRYDILESRDRIGGRVYTHHFGDRRGSYYDVGAMRFPKVSQKESP
jgi:hypothetical protein